MRLNTRTKLLVALTIATFVCSLLGSSVTVALPAIGTRFNMNAVSLTWVTTAFVLGSSVFILPVGRLADIVGRRKVLVTGLVTITVFSIIGAFSVSGLMLLFSRFMQGIGQALIIGPCIPLLVTSFPAEERGKALGVFGASVYSGQTTGPLVGGILTQYIGWSSLFFFNVIFLIIPAVMLWQLRQLSDEGSREDFDRVGSIFWGVAIIPLIYGFTLLPDIKGIWLLLLGIAFLAIFVWWETRSKLPLISMDLFKHNRIFVLSSSSALINYGATWSIAFMVSLYLQYIKGFSPQTAGFILITVPLIQAFFAPIAGRLSDRAGTRFFTSLGMGLNAAGLFILAFLSADTNIIYIILTLIIVGFGLALFISPNNAVIMSSVEPDYYGVASASLSVMRQLGMMFSMSISALIISAYIGRGEIIPQYYPGFLAGVKTTMAVFAFFSVLGVFASLARPKRKLIEMDKKTVRI